MRVCKECESGYANHHTTCPTHGGMLSEIRDLRPGMLIRNTYRIVRKLGEGGMGAVYLCDHTFMKERQALKFLSLELSKDEAFSDRFLREVQTLRQVHHKNVVKAWSLEPAEDGALFFSMEFVDGPDLRDYLDAAGKPLDVGFALAITRGIAEGLGAAHAQGMVHRDIKPENILLARAGDRYTPKVADFGIVATKENSRQYTKTGGSILTMAYAAPEQWLGMRSVDLDGRTDLYALGGLLFEMLTGQTVFDAESYEGWREQHMHAAPKPLSSVRPDLANWQGLDALVMRLLAKQREQRPRNVAEVLLLLDAIQIAPPPARTPISRAEPVRATPAPQPVWAQPVRPEPFTSAPVNPVPASWSTSPSMGHVTARRGLTRIPTWGAVVLVLAGVLTLLLSFGWISANDLWHLLHFSWPLLLIVVGFVWISWLTIQRRRMKKAGRSDSYIPAAQAAAPVAKPPLTVRRGLARFPVWVAVLVVLIGVVALLLVTGRMNAEVFWNWVGHWWPVLLIAAGLGGIVKTAIDRRRTKKSGRRFGGYMSLGILGLLTLSGVGAMVSGWHHTWEPLRATSVGSNDNCFNATGKLQHEMDQAAQAD